MCHSGTQQSRVQLQCAPERVTVPSQSRANLRKQFKVGMFGCKMSYSSHNHPRQPCLTKPFRGSHVSVTLRVHDGTTDPLGRAATWARPPFFLREMTMERAIDGTFRCP